jgi:hypothetical protein
MIFFAVFFFILAAMQDDAVAVPILQRLFALAHRENG